MSCRAAPAEDVMMAMRCGEARQGLLALAAEQALSLQLQLELLKGDMQIADALRRERRAVELVGSVTREHGNAPPAMTFIPVSGRKRRRMALPLNMTQRMALWLSFSVK